MTQEHEPNSHREAEEALRPHVRPCPFCGFARPRILALEGPGSGLFAVYCDERGGPQGCGAQGPVAKTRREAFRRWNRTLGRVEQAYEPDALLVARDGRAVICNLCGASFIGAYPLAEGKAHDCPGEPLPFGPAGTPPGR